MTNDPSFKKINSKKRMTIIKKEWKSMSKEEKTEFGKMSKED